MNNIYTIPFNQPPAATGEQIQRRLLEGLAAVQVRWITNTDPAECFQCLLESLLEVTGSEYGFIGEIRYQPGGEPSLQAYAITDLGAGNRRRGRCPHERALGAGRGFSEVVLNYHKNGQPIWMRVDIQPAARCRSWTASPPRA